LVFISAIFFAKILLLVLTTVFTSIVNIPASYGVSRTILLCNDIKIEKVKYKIFFILALTSWSSVLLDVAAERHPLDMD